MEEGQNLWTNLGGSEENVRVIAPGIVFFKNVLNEEQQVWSTNHLLELRLTMYLFSCGSLIMLLVRDRTRITDFG